MGVYPPRGFSLRTKFANETLSAARPFAANAPTAIFVNRRHYCTQLHASDGAPFSLNVVQLTSGLRRQERKARPARGQPGKLWVEIAPWQNGARTIGTLAMTLR